MRLTAVRPVYLRFCRNVSAMENAPMNLARIESANSASRGVLKRRHYHA